VHRKEFDETTLLRPDDLFYPIKKYRRIFGDVDKKKGHVITKVNGIKGQP